MKFEELSDVEKGLFWNEVEIKISHCLDLVEGFVDEDSRKGIAQYLSHNELGIAFEYLMSELIGNNVNLAQSTKNKLLNILEILDYQESDEEIYQQLLNWLQVT